MTADGKISSSQINEVTLAIEVAKMGERQIFISQMVEANAKEMKSMAEKVSKIESKIAAAAAVVAVCSATISLFVDYIIRKFM